eukprot:scaffold24322_cov30-Prasinocladus_malaysianus.AAC.1
MASITACRALRTSSDGVAGTPLSGPNSAAAARMSPKSPKADSHRSSHGISSTGSMGGANLQ